MGQMTVTNILQAGASLVGSSASEAASNLKEVLQRRLVQYFSLVGEEKPRLESGSLEDLQLRTATEALCVLERLQTIWKQSSRSVTSSDPVGEQHPSDAVIGARDLAHIRTLLSIVFKWAIEPRLSRVIDAIPVKSVPQRHLHAGAKIIDLTGVPQDFTGLRTDVLRLLGLVLPDGPKSPWLQTVITSTLVNKHFDDLLRPCLVLGWLPQTLATDSVQPVDEIRPYVMYLLTALSASQTIAALGGILSDKTVTLPYVRKSCGFLLSRQLLRPEGIFGLLTAVFGEEDVSADDAPLDKLEHVGRLLSTVPVSMKPNEYYGVIIPRLVMSLSADPGKIPPAHRRAIAFSLSYMLSSNQASSTSGVISDVLLPMLHDPFLQPTSQPAVAAETEDSPPSRSKASAMMTPAAALSALETLLTNADPSPTFITSLLSSVVPQLYAIWSHLEAMKTSDPTLKESVKGLLTTWGRVVSAPDGVDALWHVVGGEGGEWEVDIAGNLSLLETSKDSTSKSLSLFTPESLKQAEDAGEFDIDSNILDLRPDPARFVRFLKSLERTEVSSDLFVRLLEAYQEVKAQTDADSLRTLLYLQFIMQMQNQLTADSSASSILSKPDHVLSFIKHALESATAKPASPPDQGQAKVAGGIRMEDLRIVEEEEEELDDGDSDDEGPDDAPGGSSDEEMTVTALNLLLSVLEANPDLSARTVPIFNDIFSLLEQLARDSSESIRPLAREARMVMTARLASTSVPPADGKGKRKTGKDTEESPQETYQKALKLLQDPLLPVRAHGLLLLRQLVSARPSVSQFGALEEPALDRALLPAILSIFMQSIQDDDSYMYLNAVQGLSAMVDGFGKEVLRTLVGTYTEGLEGLRGTTMSQQDVDVRTRVGEALGQVIRRCGDTLPAYTHILIPSLFAVIRASHFPTTLRTSAISLLAQCTKTCSLAVLPYAVDLSEAMVDLLQVETVSARSRDRKVETVPDDDGDQNLATDTTANPTLPATMDSQPTSTYSKFPPLRRAALHFLSLLVQACIARVYETNDGNDLAFPPPLVRRAKTTLGYVAATDEDTVVRVMAREALEALEQLTEAILGL